MGRRWDKAKADSHGWVFKREIAVAIVSGALAVGALAVFGGPDVKLGSELVVVGAAILGVLLLPPLELAWNYLRAPRRLLMEDIANLVSAVGEMREQLAKAQSAPTRTRTINVRLTVLSQIRRGREILARPEMGPYGMEAAEANEWTQGVVRGPVAVCLRRRRGGVPGGGRRRDGPVGHAFAD